MYCLSGSGVRHGGTSGYHCASERKAASPGRWGSVWRGRWRDRRARWRRGARTRRDLAAAEAERQAPLREQGRARDRRHIRDRSRGSADVRRGRRPRGIFAAATASAANRFSKASGMRAVRPSSFAPTFATKARSRRSLITPSRPTASSMSPSTMRASRLKSRCTNIRPLNLTTSSAPTCAACSCR